MKLKRRFAPDADQSVSTATVFTGSSCSSGGSPVQASGGDTASHLKFDRSRPNAPAFQRRARGGEPQEEHGAMREVTRRPAGERGPESQKALMVSCRSWLSVRVWRGRPRCGRRMVATTSRALTIRVPCKASLSRFLLDTCSRVSVALWHRLNRDAPRIVCSSISRRQPRRYQENRCRRKSRAPALWHDAMTRVQSC